MNIWSFHHYAEPASGQWTGTFDLFKFLAKRGHNVTIFASSFSHYTRRDKYLQKNESYREELIDGVRFVFIKTIDYHSNGLRRLLNIIQYSIKAYSIGSKSTNHPDLIIGSTPHPLCALSGWLASKRFKCKFFFEVHDLWPQFLIEINAIKQNGLIAKMLLKLEGFLAEKADKILTLWPKMDVYFSEKHKISKDKVFWLPIGLDPDSFVESLDSLPKSDKTSPIFVVMYRGGMGKSNKLESIIHAAAVIQNRSLSHIRFILAGEGPERQSLEELVKSLNLQNVIFEDFLPKNESLLALTKADLLVGSLPDMPHFKSYGLVSTKELDYLMAGKPIVYATGIADTSVSKAKAGYIVPPDDAEKMADAIEKISQTSLDDRLIMGHNGLEYIKKHHNLKTLSQTLESLASQTIQKEATQHIKTSRNG